MANLHEIEKSVSTWHMFAVYEGLTRTLSNLLQKLVGLSAATAEFAWVSTGIIGAVQATVGLCGRFVSLRGVPGLLFANTAAIGWSVLFGVLAGLGTVVSIYTYQIGADLGIRSLIVNASVIPGALLGSLLWRDALGWRQWAGAVVYLAAVWAMLGFPGSFALDAWVWWSLLLPLFNTGSEISSRFVGIHMDLWAHNFWVGLSTVATAVLGFVALTLFFGMPSLALSQVFLWGTVATGITVVGLVTFKLIAFQRGGTIAVKKVLMQGTFMTSALVLGALVYEEPLGIAQGVGVALWFMAVYLVTDKEA